MLSKLNHQISFINFLTINLQMVDLLGLAACWRQEWSIKNHAFYAQMPDEVKEVNTFSLEIKGIISRVRIGGHLKSDV
ncbi:hypothetical protein [Spirosoma jeollabukense]